MASPPNTAPSTAPSTSGGNRKVVFEKEVIMTEKEKMRHRLIHDREAMKEEIKGMTPTDLFILFDDDDSGLISYPEFRRMLPYLDINISDAKAYRYYNVCDTDGSGEIDIDEFKVALYICDPTAGNSCGFTPTSHITPMDAFETFDEGNKGFLDEDEFFYALDYLELKVSDKDHEEFFNEFDINHTGSIDYDEFREAYLRACDIRRELEDRGVDCPAFARRKVLMNMLRPILVEEEGKERRAIAEAKRYKAWMLAIRDKKKVLQLASFRSYQELRSALDAAGHVYVFGSGTANQFSSHVVENLKTEHFRFEHFDRVVELWKDRVSPQQLIDRLRLARKAQQQEEERDEGRNVSMLKDELGGLAKKKKIIDPYLEALQSNFLNLNCALNTAVLWGRRIHHVSVSESCIFALADTGEIYCWGGNNFWWHEIQADSMYQNKWRGDVTARSQLLLGTTDKVLPPDVSLSAADIHGMSPDDKRAEIIKEVAKYYNVWAPPPNQATRMQYLNKDILPKIFYEKLVFSLELRGGSNIEGTKVELASDLYDALMLEKKLLGARASRAIKELETQVEGLIARKKKQMADQIAAKIAEMWVPLREVQGEKKAEEKALELKEAHAEVLEKENLYVDWRHRIKNKREDVNPKLTPRGNSLQINLSGITPRAGENHTPRGVEGAIQISAGAAHVCLIHKNGQLYTWGVGVSGRLGLDVTEFGDPQHDTERPRLVQALSGRPVLRVSAGYSHTAAIAVGGDLYVWGSAATGKCGLGHITKVEECYCSVPTKLMIGPEDMRIRKVSCGAAHTACITETGQMYVFGCGDGGRLGLGDGIYDTIYEPLLVSSLLHERLSSVSCGSTTTLVATEIRHEWETERGQKYKVFGGGRVYMAGSRNILGRQCDEFTLLKSMEKLPVKQVSAGYQHSAVLTAEGELYTWGQNKSNCLGVSTASIYVQEPTPVSCLFRLPENIARGKTAYQSSTYSGRDAEYAVNGDTDGNGLRRATCTQQDGQSWIEIDLGALATIEQVLVWNRTDVPSDKTLTRDFYTSRLFPCWVMVGRDPFPTGVNDGQYLKQALSVAVAKTKFTEDKRLSTWRCPAATQARYVRVQLEGFNYLGVAQIEVLGHFGFGGGVGRVSYAVAGRDVTVAVIRPNNDARDIEAAYRRAALADCENADILRQLETYALEYDKFGRGDVLKDACNICQGAELCEICRLYKLYGNELKNMPPGIGGRRRRLKSIEDFLINSSKPEIIPVVPMKKIRPTKWELRKEKFWNLLRHPMEAIFGKKEEVTPEEALEVDPQAILASFHRNEAIEQEAAEQQIKGVKSRGSTGGSTGSRGGVSATADIESVREWKNKRRLKGIGEEDYGDRHVNASSSIGTAVNHRLKEFVDPNGDNGSVDTATKSGSRSKKSRKSRAGTADSSGPPGTANSGLDSRVGTASSLPDTSRIDTATTTARPPRPPSTSSKSGKRSVKGGGFGGSVPASVSSKHGIITDPLQSGDVLPTGHVVKHPFPKIIAKKLEETADLVKDTKARAQRAVEASKKEKKVTNALFG